MNVSRETSGNIMMNKRIFNNRFYSRFILFIDKENSVISQCYLSRNVIELLFCALAGVMAFIGLCQRWKSVKGWMEKLDMEEKTGTDAGDMYVLFRCILQGVETLSLQLFTLWTVFLHVWSKGRFRNPVHVFCENCKLSAS